MSSAEQYLPEILCTEKVSDSDWNNLKPSSLTCVTVDVDHQLGSQLRLLAGTLKNGLCMWFGFLYSMITSFQEEVSEENQIKAMLPFMINPWISCSITFITVPSPARSNETRPVFHKEWEEYLFHDVKCACGMRYMVAAILKKYNPPECALWLQWFTSLPKCHIHSTSSLKTSMSHAISLKSRILSFKSDTNMVETQVKILKYNILSTVSLDLKAYKLSGQHNTGRIWFPLPPQRK